MYERFVKHFKSRSQNKHFDVTLTSYLEKYLVKTPKVIINALFKILK